jgi:hypothetical protein
MFVKLVNLFNKCPNDEVEPEVLLQDPKTTDWVSACGTCRLELSDIILDAITAKSVQALKQSDRILHYIEAYWTLELLLQFIKHWLRYGLILWVRIDLWLDLSRLANHLVIIQIEILQIDHLISSPSIVHNNFTYRILCYG